MTPYSFQSKEDTLTLPGVPPRPATKLSPSRLPNARDDWAPTRKQGLNVFSSCANLVASLDMPARRLLAELEKQCDLQRMNTRIEVDAAAVLELVNAVAAIESARVLKARSIRSADMAASQRLLGISDEVPTRADAPEGTSQSGPDKCPTKSPTE